MTFETHVVAQIDQTKQEAVESLRKHPGEFIVMLFEAGDDGETHMLSAVSPLRLGHAISCIKRMHVEAFGDFE